MFERFTEKGIKAVMLAQEESRRLGHNFVGTEMILLGVIGDNSNAASGALKSMGVYLANTRLEVEKIIGRGSGIVDVEVPFTPRCKRLLQHAWDLSERTERRIVGPAHILLGLIEEAKECEAQPPAGTLGISHRVLLSLEVDLDRLRQDVLNRLDSTMVPGEYDPTSIRVHENRPGE